MHIRTSKLHAIFHLPLLSFLPASHFALVDSGSDSLGLDRLCPLGAKRMAATEDTASPFASTVADTTTAGSAPYMMQEFQRAYRR